MGAGVGVGVGVVYYTSVRDIQKYENYFKYLVSETI